MFNSSCVIDDPYEPQTAEKCLAIEVASKTAHEKGTKRIAARQQLMHSSVVITAVMKLMDKKLLLKSGRRLSTKKQEEIKFHTKKLSRSLRQLIECDNRKTNVEQFKAFIAKLEAGIFMHPCVLR